ncbi:MAG: hypothetical protein K6V73_02815 [Firmicutes bacterium]|nr:hypothetical protein [Bacillota bacterium]
MSGQAPGATGAGPEEWRRLLSEWARELLCRPVRLRDLGSIALETARIRGLVPEDDPADAAAALLAVALLSLLGAAEAMRVPVEASVGAVVQRALGGAEPRKHG